MKSQGKVVKSFGFSLIFRRTGGFSWICRGSGGIFVDFSWIWWFSRGFLRRSGGFFVDFSSIWWFFRGLFVDLVAFSLIFHRYGVFSLIFRRCDGFFVDFSSIWWFFR